MDKKEILQFLRLGTITPEQAKKLLLQQNVKTGCEIKDIDKSHKIAIIGMSGRYPKASNIDEYWRVLKYGVDAVEEIPENRFDIDQYFAPYPPKSGKTYCKWLGYVDGIEYFDPLFFNIAPVEAETMDPHQRVFLEEAYKAFEDAGYNPKTLGNHNCGVYLGIMGNEYATLLSNNQVKISDITGDSMAIASARIAYFLNLKGPAISIDTACSSSLVCTDMAYHALLNKEIDMALVGGVTFYLTPDAFIKMSSTGMLAKDGRCKTFDNGADGFVPGEGAGAIVLKRLEDAELDGDPIYGVIIGSGINQDGRTNGITAPNVKRQKELISEVHRKYKINPETISYAETHGTGTKLGDPIELKAITKAFEERTQKRKYCAIGSVKTNFGHTSAAAGVAGIEKILLCMKNKTLVPSLHFQEPNEHFNFEQSPFYVNTKTIEWKSNSPRRACVSAFGFSGTNSHLVLEEYQKKDDMVLSKVESRTGIFVLSAKNKERIQVKANELCEYIRNSSELLLEDILYTLQVGREELETRIGFTVKTKEELIDKLEKFIRGEKESTTYFNSCKMGYVGEEIEEALYKSVWENEDIKSIHYVIERWVNGDRVDWNKLCRNRHGKRIHLPVYPFQKDKYWLVSDKSSKNEKDERIVYCLHPLVQTNCSNIDGIRFQTVITGNEPFLAEHKVAGVKTLPASAYIEMLWFGTLQALTDEKREHVLNRNKKMVLKNLYFRAPMQIRENEKNIEVCFQITDEKLSACIYEKKADNRILLCESDIYICDNDKQEEIDRKKVEKIKDNQQVIEGKACYKEFEKMNLFYGNSHQRIQSIYLLDSTAYVELIQQENVEQKVTYDVGLVDSVFQAAYGLYRMEENSQPHLPFKIESCELYGGCDIASSALMEKLPDEGDSRVINVMTYSSNGTMSMKIQRFCMVSSETEKKESRESFQEVYEKIVRGQLTRDEFEKMFGN